MQFLKSIISMICLFDLQTKEKQAVNLKRYIAFQCSQIKNDKQNLSNQNKIIQSLCKTLNRQQKGTIAPWIKAQKNKKVLLLDLDKTLIYYSGKTGLTLRPFLNNFLKQLKHYYSIYIFTSATKSYVDEIFQKAKQQKSELNSVKGILARQNCIKIQNDKAQKIYVKDLSILTNCSLSDVIIVDDLPISYCLNQQNAICISAFSGQKQDKELKKILKILLNAIQYIDVRDYLPGLHKKSSKITQKSKQKKKKIQRNFIISKT